MAITPRQFEQMQARLGGPRRRPGPVFENSLRAASSKNQIVIGVDPSLRGTGYGVIQAGRPCARALAHGTIVCPAGGGRGCWRHAAGLSERRGAEAGVLALMAQGVDCGGTAQTRTNGSVMALTALIALIAQGGLLLPWLNESKHCVLDKV